MGLFIASSVVRVRHRDGRKMPGGRLRRPSKVALRTQVEGPAVHGGSRETLLADGEEEERQTVLQTYSITQKHVRVDKEQRPLIVISPELGIL